MDLLFSRTINFAAKPDCAAMGCEHGCMRLASGDICNCPQGYRLVNKTNCQGITLIIYSYQIILFSISL